MTFAHHVGWWFDAADMYHRLAMTGFLLMIARNSELLRMAISLFISMTYLAVGMVWRPFQTKSHNEVMITGQFVVCVTVIGGYVSETLDRRKAIVGWLLLIANIAIVLMTFFHQRSERLFNIVHALHAGEDFSATELADLWEGSPKITLTSALLEGAAVTLTNCEQAETDDEADVHWKYLIDKLLRLRDSEDQEFIFN